MEYYMPDSLKQLELALAKKDQNTYLCGGATDLMIHLRNRECYEYSIIDLTHLSAICQIEEDDEKIRIGAGVTMDMLENSAIIQKNVPALSKAAGMVGSTQIRNLATIGGNIANASQCADTVPVLFAYKARAVILNEEGIQRALPLEEIIVDIGEIALGEKEALIYIEIEKSKEYSGFSKVGSRKAVTISKVNACIKGKIQDGIIHRAVVYLGAVGKKALPAPEIEKALEKQKLLQIKEERIKEAVIKQIEINIPNRPSKQYKKFAAFGTIMDIVEEMQEKERGR